MQYAKLKKVTVGLSIHRPEMLPLMADSMKNHATIIMEEPPTPGFHKMLSGALAIDEYLMPIDVEYPEFSRRMCHLLQELLQCDKQIFQVEPFLQNLLALHTFFAQGHGPQDLNRDSVQYRVYLAERNATGSLFWSTIRPS